MSSRRLRTSKSYRPTNSGGLFPQDQPAPSVRVVNGTEVALNGRGWLQRSQQLFSPALARAPNRGDALLTGVTCRAGACYLLATDSVPFPARACPPLPPRMKEPHEE